MVTSGLRTIAPEGALTMSTVRGWQEAGLAALREGGLVFDLRRVTETDSAALACVFNLVREARARDRQLRLVGLSDKLRNLASVYGVASLLPEVVRPDLE